MCAILPGQDISGGVGNPGGMEAFCAQPAGVAMSTGAAFAVVLGITVLGCACLIAWTVEDIRVARFDEPYRVGAYSVTLKDVQRIEGPNYFADRAEVSLVRDGGTPFTVFPEKRMYPVAGMPTTEAGIHNGFWRDLYVVIGERQPDGGWAVRTYIKPFANWIWGGAILMALGGFVSLSDRRLRVGVAAARAPGARGVPAE